jgi:hypothetical protein
MPTIKDLQGEPLKTPHAIFGHAVYLSIHPGRLITIPFKHWFRKHYKGKYKFEHAVFTFDLFLIGCVLTLAMTLFFFILFPLKQFRDGITFTATVAPHEVISGAPSTLVIEYKNETKEMLENPKLSFSFPKYFLLKSISYNGANVPDRNISLTTIPVGGTGTIHIQGTMFGDVGGKQLFGSTLTFTHGTKEKRQDQKSDTYVFSPAHSTLSLELSLPDRAIASQTMAGIITYKNTGTIDLRGIRIKPEWPKGFTFLDASAQIQNDEFVLSNLKAGGSGEIHFKGKLGDVPKELPFIFHPSFVFGKDRYTQEILAKTIPILPAQIQLSLSTDAASLIPGKETTFKIHYKHIGDEPLQNISFGVTSRNPFFTKQETFTQALKTLKPGEEGDVSITVPIRSQVSVNDLTSYQNIRVRANAIARYVRDSHADEQLSSSSQDTETPLTTPFVIDSFARYTSPEGDQLGRGPLPPRSGQKTSYWVFWNVYGTTNTINNAVIEGTLPGNVSLSGRQTSSQDSGVVFDEATRKVSWKIEAIPPTFDPQTPVFSTAFEVIVTPTTSQIGSSAALIKDILFKGTDTFTNTPLSSSLSSITTHLPNDSMASGKGLVK